MDADDVFLRHGRDVGKLLLDVAQRGVRDMAVAIRDDDEHRRDRERDQRELPFEDEEHGRDRQHCERVLEEEDQPVPEEEPDALQVDRRTRHQLTRLMTVVETERESDEMRVQALAHVHLDGERLFSGDESASRHQHRTREAEADDRPHEEPELVRVLRAERVVDDVLRHPDDRDLRGLRGDGEDDRNRERELVRPQEAE